MTLFMQKFKEGLHQFPGLYGLLVCMERERFSTETDRTIDMKNFGHAVIENPDAFSLWMQELFRLAVGIEEYDVYCRCHTVYQIWQYLQKHTEALMWLPFETPAANNQYFRYVNRSPEQ